MAPNWLPKLPKLGRRAQEKAATDQDAKSESSIYDEVSPLECIFRVFMTACVAAKSVSQRGLANALPPTTGRPSASETEQVPLTPYTMLVVASAVRRTESELRSFPISPSTSCRSTPRTLSRCESSDDLAGADSSKEGYHLDDELLKKKSLQVVVDGNGYADLSSQSSCSCSLPGTPRLETPQRRRAAPPSTPPCSPAGAFTPLSCSSAVPSTSQSAAPSMSGSAAPSCSISRATSVASSMPSNAFATLLTEQQQQQQSQWQQQRQQQQQQRQQPVLFPSPAAPTRTMPAPSTADSADSDWAAESAAVAVSPATCNAVQESAAAPVLPFPVSLVKEADNKLPSASAAAVPEQQQWLEQRQDGTAAASPEAASGRTERCMLSAAAVQLASYPLPASYPLADCSSQEEVDEEPAVAAVEAIGAASQEAVPAAPPNTEAAAPAREEQDASSSSGGSGGGKVHGSKAAGRWRQRGMRLVQHALVTGATVAVLEIGGRACAHAISSAAKAARARRAAGTAVAADTAGNKEVSSFAPLAQGRADASRLGHKTYHEAVAKEAQARREEFLKARKAQRRQAAAAAQPSRLQQCPAMVVAN